MTHFHSQCEKKCEREGATRKASKTATKKWKKKETKRQIAAKMQIIFELNTNIKSNYAGCHSTFIQTLSSRFKILKCSVEYRFCLVLLMQLNFWERKRQKKNVDRIHEYHKKSVDDWGMLENEFIPIVSMFTVHPNVIDWHMIEWVARKQIYHKMCNFGFGSRDRTHT